MTTTTYALDAAMGLAEVIFTSEGHAYLHLPGLIVTEAASGTRRYLLSDGLGSVRHVTNEAGQLVSTHEFDPYGVPLTEPTGDPYGYTGEWWQADIGLLHLRARWYDPASGTFLSVDPVESEPPYQYVRGNTINLTDPSGNAPNNSNSTHLTAIYCYNQATKKLTLNSDPTTPCATNVGISGEDRGRVLSRVRGLQSSFPTTRIWAELDKAWKYSVYVTLDLSAYGPQDKNYCQTAGSNCTELSVKNNSDKVKVPTVWLRDNPEDGLATVSFQGTGKIPSTYHDTYGGWFIDSSIGPISTYVTGGRSKRKINNALEFKAAAAPYQGSCAFPNQAALFAPAIAPFNPTAILSVEDTGGAIDCINGRIDVYVGINTRDGAIAQNSKWGGSNAWHTVWPLVGLNKPLTDECDLPQTIDNVNILNGFGVLYTITFN